MQFQKNNLDNLKKSKKTKKSKKPKRKYNEENPQDSDYEREMVYTSPNVNLDLNQINENPEQYDPNDQLYQNPNERGTYQSFRRPKRKNFSQEKRKRRSRNEFNADFPGEDHDQQRQTKRRRSKNYQNRTNDIYDGNQYEDDENQEYQNESEIPKTIIFSRNRYTPPFFEGAIPTNQMTPRQTYDELNTSFDKNNEQNMKKRNYLKTYEPIQEDDNPSQSFKNSNGSNILKDEVSKKYNNKTNNNISYKDIKKLSNRFDRVYNPYKNDNGQFEESQEAIPGAQDEVFNNRYKVLSKMKRLSNILLAKKRSNSPKRRDNDNIKSNKNRKFDRHTSGRTPDEEKNIKELSRLPNNKFLYVSLAMISNKGLNSDDKPVLRSMRIEKGGVVDFAQEEGKKSKFSIKKAKPKKGANKATNPKNREKAAKIIQSWWRDLNNIYNDRLSKIIKIQSVFRGKFVRKYMYDLFYLNYLYISFCKKIENVLRKQIKPYVWDKLFKKTPKREIPKKKQTLKKIVARDYRNDLNSILPVWKKWVSNTQKLNKQSKRGRNLVHIRADKDNKLNQIRNAFNKWKYINKVLDAEDKLIKNINKLKKENERKKNQDKENNLKNIKGLFGLLDGIDKYTKKEGLKRTLPKLEDYLKNNKGNGKLRRIVNKQPNYKKNLLRKAFYKWLGKTYKNKKYDDINKKQKDELEKLKKRILKNIIKNIKKKQEKNILKKVLYKWLKKSILIAIKEEKEKQKKKDKEYKDKEIEIIEQYEKKITTYERQKKIDDDETRKIKNALDKLKKESKDREEDLMKNLKENQKNKDKNLLYYKKGAEILQRAVWRITHRDPLNALGDKIDNGNTSNKLTRLVKIKKLTDKELLRKYFNIWRRNTLKGVDPDILYKLLAKLIEITSNNYKKRILAKKFNKWRREARKNPYDTLKKAKDIYDFGDLIRKIFVKQYGDPFLEKLRKTKNPNKLKVPLNRIVKNKATGDKEKLRNALYKWRKYVQNINIKRLKSKIIYKIYDKKHPNLDKDLLNKYFQIWKNKAFKNKILRYKTDLNIIRSKQTDTRRIFVKSIVKGLDKRTKNDLLREYFNYWKRLVELDKNENYQKDKKRIMLAKILEKKNSNAYLTLLKNLLKWKNKIYELKVVDVHKPYRQQIIRILLTKNDKEVLQKYFNKWRYGSIKRLPLMLCVVAKRFLKKVLCHRPFNEFVKKMTERDPNVLKNKGRELNKALTDIKRNRSREFIKKLIRIIQIKYLRKIQPKVNDKLKEYYLRKYFDRWVDNTLGVIERKKEIITKWIKNRITENKIKNDKRKKELLKKIFDNLDKSNRLNLAHSLLKYRKNVKLDEQNDFSEIIQKFCRKQLKNIYEIQKEKRNELFNLLNRLHTKIFINDLNDVANALMPFIKSKNAQNKFKIDKLRKNINKSEKMKNLALLRKYWNIWKSNPGLLEKYSILIQSKVRKMISKKKLGNIRKLKDILFKLMMTNKDKQKELLVSKFYQWRKIARKIECEENSEIIKEFCRKRLGKYLKKKFGNYLYDLLKKYITYLISNNIKVDKLNKALRHNPLKDAFYAIKKRTLINIIKDSLIYVLEKQDDINKSVLLLHFLDKWREKVNQLKNIENDKVSKIQSIFRGHNFRKFFFADEKKIKLLKIITEKLIMASDPKKILDSAFSRWRKKAARIEFEENAQIIQDFCRRIRDNIVIKKNKQIRENYKNLANNIQKIKVSPKEFFDKLKEIRRNQILEELLDDLNKKRLDNLKWASDKIKEYQKYTYLLKSMNIKNNANTRLLKEYFKKWKNKVMRTKGIMELLRRIFNTYDDFNNNLLRHYLNKWLYKAKYITQQKKAYIISDFCKDILEKTQALRNWRKLSDGLKKKDKNEEIEYILVTLRYVVGLNRIIKIITNHVKKDVFDNLNNNKNVKTFIYKIRPLLNKNDKFWNNNLLRKYFDKWRDNVDKLNKREEGIDNIMDIYDNLRKKKAVNDINDAFLVKKFLHDYPLVGALGFLKKLKDLSKGSKLAEDLIKAKNDLEPIKRKDLIQKIIKIYSYKVLDNLFNNLENIQENKLIPLKKEFFGKLINNLIRGAERSYNDNKTNEIVPKNIKTSFRLKKPNKIKDNQKKRLIYSSLLPSLIHYINEIILNQKEDIYNKIKDKSNSDKFCELYKRWVEKQELEPKKELIDILKIIYEREISEGPLLVKLFRILRHEAIRRILKNAPKIKKVLDGVYVTRLLVMKREIAKEIFLRKIIRRWRYLVFSKKLAASKLKTIYKNLHLTYLEMANTLFGEDNKNDDPSVLKEFERFGTSVGIWENEKPNEKEEEKYVKIIKTKYVFDPLEFEKYQSKYYPTEYEEKYYKREEKKVEKEIEYGKEPKRDYGKKIYTKRIPK